MAKAILEDQFHVQKLAECESVEEAVSELRRLEQLDSQHLEWELGPCPCSSNCGRRELVVWSGGRIVAAARVIDPEGEP